ncbi:hypothetical protein AAFF_G00348450 [Aldrovandia affinis]|uniref:Endonuclease/exonuclease/phosphatase domain-containing protein n=1 Tax=Aldrovandia affinis TaxID=143900 RepID=A0AAD7R5U0_9TELE|nr:hypothetical protein AAFF_G00348450 [Aldrovandia affinis]
MKNKVIPNPILPAAESAGTSQRMVVLVLLPEDNMTIGPQTRKGGSSPITAPVQCTLALSETIRNGNLQRMILIAEFSGNPVTTVIVVYSPTNVAPPEEVEKFYEDLATAVRDVPAHNFLAILGDFNARLDQRTHASHTTTLPTATAHTSLPFSWNTSYCRQTPCSEKNRQEMDLPRPSLRYATSIDYILVRQKWRNSILNAEPYSTFSSVGSDHRVVSMRVRLSLRVPKPSPRIRTSLQSRHPDIVVARGRVEEARLGYVSEPTVERRGILNEAKQLLFSTYDKIKGEELMERVQRVQAAQGERQYGEAWRVINEMTGRKRTKEGQVEGHSPEERVVTWFNHFEGCWAQQQREMRKKYHHSSRTSTSMMVPSRPVSLPGKNYAERAKVLGRTAYPRGLKELWSRQHHPTVL